MKMSRMLPLSPLCKHCLSRLPKSRGSRQYFNHQNDGHVPLSDLVRRMKRLVEYKHFDHTQPQKSRSKSIKIKPQSELSLRHMIPQHAMIPLGTNIQLREHYNTSFGSLRFGRMLEDLDFFAAWIAFCHCTDDPDSPDARYPHTLVTALVDRISVISDRRLMPNMDVYLSGHVTWVGQSSMEISMNIAQALEPAGEPVEKLEAKFVFVARTIDGSKAYVNPLELRNSIEEKTFKEGEERTQKRRVESTQSLLRTVPSEAERKLIHDLFLKTVEPQSSSYHVRRMPHECMWMNDTRLKNVIICHPDKRNIHSKIFGGYLMRIAFELAWTAVMLHCADRPRIVAIHDILFRKPVDIGSILKLSARVVYIEGTKLQTRVHASVINPQDQTFDTTNIFQFTFQVDRPGKVIVPMTYAGVIVIKPHPNDLDWFRGMWLDQGSLVAREIMLEAMMYLDGKRHFDLHLKSNVT